MASALRDDAITVGSFDFGESELLAEIYSAALEGEGFEVERVLGVGSRELVLPALTGGLLELVPEYSGTALQFVSLDRAVPVADVRATHAALRDALAGGPVVAMAPSPAQDTNAFVVTRETATRYGLAAISDLATVAWRLTFGGPPECPSRPFCLQGLEEVYGLEFGRFLSLDVGGPLTQEALESGHVDVALLFSTDPALIDGDFVPLADDRGLQPAENVTPLVRREVLDRWGARFEQVVDGVSRSLTTTALRELNEQMADGADASTVASEWLASQEVGS